YNLGNSMGGVMFVASDGVSPEALRPRIERILSSHHPIHPDDHNAMFFFDVSSRFKMVDNLFTGISLLAMFVGAGTLLAGIIGVGNIMWVIVKERTQEIGIRRAIGAKPSDIITQVLSEGVMLTVIAGIAGICFATLVLAVAQHITTDAVSVPRFQLSFSSAMSIMATFIILGTLAGLIPSIKAMRIKPIEAMNDK
ncbi:MAG: FtsX-like permease family protein, partial [Muribaculaceae bacterium]|nr:FtsX-like permease family protein [Muribaculaceae bacterium]